MAIFFSQCLTCHPTIGHSHRQKTWFHNLSHCCQNYLLSLHCSSCLYTSSYHFQYCFYTSPYSSRSSYCPPHLLISPPCISFAFPTPLLSTHLMTCPQNLILKMTLHIWKNNINQFNNPCSKLFPGVLIFQQTYLSSLIMCPHYIPYYLFITQQIE